MLLISIGLWCVVVFSSRVAFLGNPLYLHIVRTAPEALERLDELALAGASPTQQEDVEFMRRFMRLFWLELV